MNKVFWITTATQCQLTSAHLINYCTCVIAATELEAVAIALNHQPEQTYIFWIEVCQPQIYLFALDQATFIQQLFKAWQDLAAEATGHDTEWSYPISIDFFSQALHISRKALTTLLKTLMQPELELCLNSTALAFHQPPIHSKKNLLTQKNDTTHVSDLTPLRAVVSGKPSSVWSTPVATR